MQIDRYAEAFHKLTSSPSATIALFTRSFGIDVAVSVLSFAGETLLYTATKMTEKVCVVDRIESEMSALSLSKGATQIPAKKKAAQAPGQPVQLMTNVYKLALQKAPIYRFDVDIVLKMGDRSIKVVKKDAQDYLAVNHKDQAKATFLKVVEKHRDVFGKRQDLFYDLQSTLFSISKLPITEKSGREFILSTDDLPGVFGRVDAISFIVKPVTDKYQMTMDDLSFLNTSDVKSLKHDLAQFLEIASSQHALFDEDHVSFTTGISYVKSSGQPVNYEPSKLLCSGVQKSARFVEGLGSAEATLVLDSNKACFHKEGQTLYAKATQSIRNWPRDDRVNPRDVTSISKQFKGLYVETNLQRVRQYEISGIIAQNSKQITFDCQGQKVSVFEYFAKQYGKRLQHPDAPLAISKHKFKGKTETTHLPLELCMVLPNQRVKKDQETPQQTASVIKLCAIVPSRRKEDIRFQADKLGLWKPHTFPFSVEANPLVVQGRHLPPPSIQYGGQATVTVNPNTGKWQAIKGQNKNARLPFAIPGNCRIPGVDKWPWAVAYLVQDDRGMDKLAENFARAIDAECTARGMKSFPRPLIKSISPNELELGNPDNFFAKLSQNKIRFCLLIEDDHYSYHGLIKANEQKFKVITQDVKLSTVNDFKFNLGYQSGYGKGQTLENLCLKTNVKLGGLNHILKAPQGFDKIFAKNRMYVGLGISHGSPLTEFQKARGQKAVPSVIGICANHLGAHVQALAGDYFYQEAREDKMVSSLAKIFDTYAAMFKKVRPEINEVYVFRVGASEGQYSEILQNEVPLMRAGLKAAGVNAKLTLVVPSKTHHLRMYPAQIKAEDKAPFQNVKPGTVVDSRIVHPKFPEFFLTSHQTLQGTANTPRYNILVDDAAVPIHEHEMTAYAWSYGHQIVGLPTSLPAPAYIASSYAERGRVIAQQYDLMNPAFLDDNAHQDFDKMTQALSMGPFNRYRVNA
ncbi:hypothetical protein QR680_018567 [Steinernema hermaphroditum]|uniref:Piwi domain-containing protein n=1 Tax=Steinernema hermaphroditum TaxID=289476 RepID=A0AA39HIE1_9BILA|nr:hypothetical protein QR680_018567 [Steinernema hermaphroditum]